MNSDGTIYWTELLTEDIAASKAFFTEVIGWVAEEMPGMQGKYVLMKNDAGPACGIMAIEGTALEAADSGPVWVSYIGVGDVDAVVDRALQNGGSVVQAPFNVPGIGRICLLAEASGVPFGVICPA